MNTEDRNEAIRQWNQRSEELQRQYQELKEQAEEAFRTNGVCGAYFEITGRLEACDGSLAERDANRP